MLVRLIRYWQKPPKISRPVSAQLPMSSAFLEPSLVQGKLTSFLMSFPSINELAAAAVLLEADSPISDVVLQTSFEFNR
jgi:hypothetical protein